MIGTRKVIAIATATSLWACTSGKAPERYTPASASKGAAAEKDANPSDSADMQDNLPNSGGIASDTQPGSQSQSGGTAGGASSEAPADPNTAQATGPFPTINFKLLNPPTGKSDVYSYSLTIEADAAISHYAFKIDSPDNCSKGSGYKVETTKTPLAVSIGSRADGNVAICLLAYYFPAKQWMAPADAKVFAWEKTAFNRKISAAYEEFDEFCGKTIFTQTEIDIKGEVAVYNWIRDAEAQGCDEPLDQGKDVMTIQSNDEKEMRGFWAFGGGGASGWFHFTWADATRNAFTGKFGYGEPDLKPEGSWNSLPAASKP